MIRHFCDACGHECRSGTNIPDRRRHLVPAKQTKRHAETHSSWRTVRVDVRFGLDGVNPQAEHPGHDLCDSCRAVLLRQIADELDPPA